MRARVVNYDTGAAHAGGELKRGENRTFAVALPHRVCRLPEPPALPKICKYDQWLNLAPGSEPAPYIAGRPMWGPGQAAGVNFVALFPANLWTLGPNPTLQALQPRAWAKVAEEQHQDGFSSSSASESV